MRFVRLFRPSPTLVQLAHLQISLFVVHRLPFISQSYGADLHTCGLAVVIEGGGEAAVGIETGVRVPVERAAVILRLDRIGLVAVVAVIKMVGQVKAVQDDAAVTIGGTFARIGHESEVKLHVGLAHAASARHFRVARLKISVYTYLVLSFQLS